MLHIGKHNTENRHTLDIGISNSEKRHRKIRLRERLRSIGESGLEAQSVLVLRTELTGYWVLSPGV